MRSLGRWLPLLALGCPGSPGKDSDAAAVERFHAEGYGDPAVHGVDAKLQVLECVNCHGADLGGGTTGYACDACHPSGWRADCTFCHGGEESSGGAPPAYIHDDGTNNFPVHTAHVVDNAIAVAIGCEACHLEPADVLDPGHVFLADSTAGVAEVDFSAGLSRAAAFDGLGTCSNLYCHGNGQGDNGTAAAGLFAATCDGCHPAADSSRELLATMSGDHELHLAEDGGVVCESCHADVASGSETIVDGGLHVDGSPQVTLDAGIAYDAAAGTCTGECHGERHEGLGWE
jgi:predicted CxxxxCH...CXXCH cytochrome family protein